MAAQELARWTRFAAKGGVGRCTATVDCVAREIGDLMFLKDDEITVLMQLPETGYYLGFCEGVVGRFSGTDVNFHGKLKRPVMAKRGSLGVADTRPMSLERTSPSWPENSSGARAGSSNANRPGSSLVRADSASGSRSGGSPVRRKPLSPDMYLYSSSPERLREYERTRGRAQELTASVSGSSVYSTVSTSSAASTTFSDGDGWRNSEDSFLSSGVVQSSSSGSVQASSSTKSVPTSSSSMDSMPASSSNSTPATSSAQSIPSLGSTHTSSVGSVEKLLQSLSNHSPSMSQSTSGSVSTSVSESMSGTFLNSSSTYGSLTSAPTSNSSSSSTNFATIATKGLTVAPLRLSKSPRLSATPMLSPMSPLLPSPGSGTTSRAYSPLPSRSPLLGSFTLPAKSSPPRSPLPPPPGEIPQSPPSPPSTASSAPESNSDADDSSLYLNDDHDHEHESTQFSTLHRHLEGAEEEEDGETGIGLSLLGALAIDDEDDEDESANGYGDRPWLGVGGGHDLGDIAEESTATDASTPIPWTKYTPSISASPAVEHEVNSNAPHASFETETKQDDTGTHVNEPGQHLDRKGEIGKDRDEEDEEKEEEEEENDDDDDEEGYWARASDIYDDYRYSRHSFSSKRMSTISVKSKAHMSILSGGGKVPPVPSFSPDRLSFDALSRPSVSSGRPSVSGGRPSVSSGRPSVSSTSSPSQPDRANTSSMYTHPTASVYSRSSLESTSSVDPGSSVSLGHTPHGPVDGPEVRLRPPVARQFSAGQESMRTLSTYSVQALSPLSAQFPQVPTGVPSRLRVTSTDMEDESEGEGEGMGLGGGKALPHAINPVSPLLYASFGANERHSGYTEETEMQSSGYSESDDGHASRKSRGLRSDAGSVRSPVSSTDRSSAISALRTRTESGPEQRIGLGMRLVVDDDDEDHPVVDEDVGVEGDTSFVSSETGTASTGHTVTPASLLPSPTGVPSALMPRTPAALAPGSPSTPTSSVSLTPVTSSALSPSAPSVGNSPSGQDAPPPSTLRPRQPNQAPHPFSRTSIFLPHPNAPKIAPGSQGLGPMYARPQHSTASPGSIPPVQLPPNTTAFSVQVLRHLRSISLGPGIGAGVRRPPMTLYARCEPDLNSSTGPVPIMFSMDPLPPLQSRKAHPGVTAPPSMAPVPPVRAATVSVPIRRSSAAHTAVAPLRGAPPPSSAKDTSPNPSADSTSTSPLRLPRRSVTALAGVQEPTTSNSAPVAPISRPNFVPQVGAARPRSRSFSGFGETGNVGALPERSREEPVSKAQSVSVTAASVVTPSPSSQPAPTPNGLPASLRARHIPSPLSLQNGNLNRERSPNTIVSSTDTPSPNAGQLKSPVTPGFQQPSPIPSVTKFGLQPPSTGSSSASPVPSFSPSNFSDRDKDASPASAMTGRTSVSTNNVTSPHPWVTNVRHGSSDTPRKNSIDSAPPRQSSDSTDSRSQMASPPPIAELHSQSARSSPLTHEVQLRGKLSLPALRGKMSIKSKLDDAVSVTSSLDNQESETVQVQDMDFELVKPTLPQASLGRSSQESSYAGRDADAVYLDSPGIMQGDAASMHSSAPRSPLFSDAISPGTPPVESPISIDAHRQREVKWMTLLPMVPPSQARRNKKVKRLLLDGVPSSVRYLVWCHLSDSKARAIPGVYVQLGKRPRVPAFSDIEKDAKAYFPDQTQLHPFDGPLVSLLQAYLNMVPDIQYSSGLTSIAGHLLLLSPEEDAFWIFASLMDAHLRPYFSVNTIQLEVDAALLSRAIEANDPSVCKKLYVTFSIPPSAIAKAWFSTLFVGTLPVDYLHRIWDVFLYEGVTLLFRVGLALVQCMRHLLLQATSEEAAMEYLVHPPLACLPSTADAFLNQALMMKLKDDDVRKQRIKMEAQVKRQTQSRTNGSSGMQTASISLPKTS